MKSIAASATSPYQSVNRIPSSAMRSVFGVQYPINQSPWQLRFAIPMSAPRRSRSRPAERCASASSTSSPSSAFASLWFALALSQGHGRHLAFKILTR